MFHVFGQSLELLFLLTDEASHPLLDLIFLQLLSLSSVLQLRQLERESVCVCE